jgi:hypothetical protein
VKWPPVTIEEGGNVYLAGVNPKEVGAIHRADGQVQITVGGRPVYRFSGDSEPGDLNGRASAAPGSRWARPATRRRAEPPSRTPEPSPRVEPMRGSYEPVVPKVTL